MTTTRIRVGFNAWVLSNPDVRGLVRYTTELLRALSRRNDIEIVLFSPEPLHPPHLEGVRARSVVVATDRETLWVDLALPRKLREWDIDIFHAPADRGLPLPKPCPFVVTIHESYERTYWRELFPTAKSRLWYWKYELSNRYGADAVLTVSETTRRKLVDLKIARESQCHRVYLASAPEFQAASDPSDTDIIRKYDLRPPYVLYVGGYDARKNVGALVRAFDVVKFQDRQLAIVAKKQWEYRSLLERWRQLTCFPNLRFIEPSSSELPALYRQADCLVNPSLWESFSLPLVEAMACGAPVLCSNRTALPEIAGDAAEYFDPENRGEFVRRLQIFAADSKLKARLRQKGFKRAREFSWDETAEQTVAVYRAVLGRQSGQEQRHESQCAPQQDRSHDITAVTPEWYR
jgi:glycosyltransferase involved in cell wall biosynthesis